MRPEVHDIELENILVESSRVSGIIPVHLIPEKPYLILNKCVVYEFNGTAFDLMAVDINFKIAGCWQDTLSLNSARLNNKARLNLQPIIKYSPTDQDPMSCVSPQERLAAFQYTSEIFFSHIWLLHNSLMLDTLNGFNPSWDVIVKCSSSHLDAVTPLILERPMTTLQCGASKRFIVQAKQLALIEKKKAALGGF